MKPGDKTSGTLKLSPSSPPVNSDSWDASVRNAEATANVIMAKKMARTRSEKSPINKASAKDTSKPPSRPAKSASQVGPNRVAAIAMP